MEREIKSPSVYRGVVHLAQVPGAVWDFQAALDIKASATYQISTSAQEQTETAVVVGALNVSAGNASCIMQEYILQETPLVVWNYDIYCQVACTTPGLILAPYVVQGEDSDADSANFQFLPADCRPSNALLATTSCRAQGSVIRSLESATASEDTNVLIFGILFNNPGSTDITIEGIAQLNVYPNSKTLVMDVPGQ